MERAKVLFEECLKLYQEAQGTQKTPDMAFAPDGLGWLALWLVLQGGNDHLIRSLLEGSRTLARKVGDKRNLASLLLVVGQIAINQSKYAEARSLLEESLALYQEMNNQQQIMWSFFHLGASSLRKAMRHALLSAWRTALRSSRAVNDKPASACSLYLLGRFALARGDATSARVLLEESLAQFRALGLHQHTAYVLSLLAVVSMIQHDEAAAGVFYEESLALFRQVKDQEGLAYCLRRWGSMAAQQGADVWAARLWGTAETLLDVDGLRTPFLLLIELTDYEQADYERMVGLVRARLGSEPLLSPGLRDET